MIIYYLIAVVLVGIDQLIKYFTVQNIELGEVIELIPNVLSLTYIRNTGAAWSILEGQMIFFYIVTIVIVAILIYFLHTDGKNSKLFSISISFLLGGAIGNFIDRLAFEFVIDMFQLEFISFPIFNFADTSLTIGVILMIIHLVIDEVSMYKKRRGSLENNEE